MAPSGQELFFAVRWRQVARYLGQFCLIVAVLNGVTLGAALFHAELSIAADYALVVAVLAVAGALLGRVKTSGPMQVNEALVLAASVYLVVPLVAAVPLFLHGATWIDAWFETVSAATTTGLSTHASVAQLPQTFLFARAWMQWYGGLGIVVLSLALVVRPGMNALRLATLDAPDDLVGGTRAHARRVLKVYMALTAVGLLVWLLLGGRPVEGLLYMFSAVSTGGFAPTDNSLADLTGLRLAWIVTLAALAGSVPLALYHRVAREGGRPILGNLELRALLVAGAAVSCLFGASLWSQGMPLRDVLVHGPLMALSAQSTSGFSSMDPATLAAGPKAILIVAMATGGCVGSTAGGFKLLRLLILLGLVYRSLVAMSLSTNAVVGQRLGKRRIDASEVQDALMIILMFLTVVFVSWVPFLFFGYAPLDALFEVVSATGTVGLSAGVTQAAMPDLLKAILCVDMLLGRLEFVAWTVFFYHRTWFGRKRGTS